MEIPKSFNLNKGFTFLKSILTTAKSSELIYKIPLKSLDPFGSQLIIYTN